MWENSGLDFRGRLNRLLSEMCITDAKLPFVFVAVKRGCLEDKIVLFTLAVSVPQAASGFAAVYYGSNVLMYSALQLGYFICRRAQWLVPYCH